MNLFLLVFKNLLFDIFVLFNMFILDSLNFILKFLFQFLLIDLFIKLLGETYLLVFPLKSLLLKFESILLLLIKGNFVPDWYPVRLNCRVIKVCSRFVETLMKRLSWEISQFTFFFQYLNFWIVWAFWLKRRALNSCCLWFSYIVLIGNWLLITDGEMRFCFWKYDLRKLFFYSRGSLKLWII